MYFESNRIDKSNRINPWVEPWVDPWVEPMGRPMGRTHGSKHVIRKTKKTRSARTIIFPAVSRRDLCYVSENERFCFLQQIFQKLIPNCGGTPLPAGVAARFPPASRRRDAQLGPSPLRTKQEPFALALGNKNQRFFPMFSPLRDPLKPSASQPASQPASQLASQPAGQNVAPCVSGFILILPTTHFISACVRTFSY